MNYLKFSRNYFCYHVSNIFAFKSARSNPLIFFHSTKFLTSSHWLHEITEWNLRNEFTRLEVCSKIYQVFSSWLNNENWEGRELFDCDNTLKGKYFGETEGNWGESARFSYGKRSCSQRGSLHCAKFKLCVSFSPIPIEIFLSSLTTVFK